LALAEEGLRVSIVDSSAEKESSNEKQIKLVENIISFLRMGYCSWKKG
jgi:hypothetical protein